LAGVAVAGGALLGVCATQAAQAVPAAMGNDPGTVNLNPASGPTSSTPAWSTTVACPSGFQQSATFKEVHADETTTNLIAPIVNRTAAPFSGTLQASIAQIKSAGGIPNGGTQELFVTCYSAYSGTGNAQNYMNIYITYSADGTSYTTTTRPSTSGGGAALTSSGSPAPSPHGTSADSSSLSGGTPSPSTSSVSPSQTSPASIAPSPSPLDSSFAVTG
jgi:hypothetical protein